jgi:hypothetical protein
MRGLRVVARVAILLIVAAAFGVAELWLRTTRADSVYTEIQRHPPHPFLQAVPRRWPSITSTPRGFVGRRHDTEAAARISDFHDRRIDDARREQSVRRDYPYLLQTLLRGNTRTCISRCSTPGAPGTERARTRVVCEVGSTSLTW